MKTRLILAAAATVFAASFAVSAPTFASLISGANSNEVESETITTGSARFVPVSAQPEPPQMIEEVTVTVSPAADTAEAVDAQPTTTVAPAVPEAPAATEASEAAPNTTALAPTTTAPAPTTTVAPAAPEAPEAAPTTTVAPTPITTPPPPPAAPSCVESAISVATSLLAPHGIPVPEFNLDPSSGPKAYYTVGGGITIRDCVSDSIVAHELGHYVHFRVAKSWGAMATDSWAFCLGYDASTSRCEGGWLSDAGKTSEGRVMPGVEHAAHCIGNILGVAGSYTKCPDDQLRAHATTMLGSA
ncbi:MAG: hypothetical protein L7T83_10885 [Ilumatobacteraceae bacterium]|nr:hypothetical protein [Ilumatobacteraceae bacterium]